MIRFTASLRQSGSRFLVLRFSSSSSYNSQPDNFKPVFYFPYIGHIAAFNGIKKYQGIGTGILVPSVYLLECFEYLPAYSAFQAGVIGVTVFGMLSSFSLMTNNMIGFIYVSDDNKHIKVSTVSFWGKRRDHVIPLEDWTPLSDLEPTNLDLIYLKPKLTDGTNMKLMIKLGNVLDKHKMGMYIE